MSSTNIGKSTTLYFPYYNPDIHFNKVNYTSNFNSIGDLLLTNYDHGLVELTGTTEYQNDYRYFVNTHNNSMWNYGNLYLANNGNDTGTIILSSVSTVNRTTTDKLSANNLNINRIFGLTTADPSVIDYNWYSGANGYNIFSTPQELTDVEQTKLGYKLFTYSASTGLNNYQTGTLNNPDLNSNTYIVNQLNNDLTNGTYSILQTGSITQIIDINGNPVNVNNNQKLYDLEEAWPYKVQYNSSQWYQVMTNGTEDALLTLPYENTAGTYQYLFTKTTSGNNENNTYKYTPLGDIVKNDYYYICSYFDTRATTQTTNNVPSTVSSLFNENTIQFMPLTSIKIGDDTFTGILHGGHTAGITSMHSSLIASCIPIAFTTAQSTNFSFVNDDGSIGQETGNIYNNINPIGLEWGKNITVNTTLNYTCANMTNLANILTGWDYLKQDFSGDGSKLLRGNLPYINLGLVIFIPTKDSNYGTQTTGDNTYASLSAFTRYTNWLNLFGLNELSDNTPFWNLSNIILTNSQVNTYINNIYNTINTNSTDWNNFTVDVINSLSTPACLNFSYSNRATIDENKYLYDDKYNIDTTTSNASYNFLGVKFNETDPAGLSNTEGNGKTSDGIRLINVLSVPITNAVNTTHTVTDNFTFRCEKPLNISTDVGNYYYIVGLYIYLTKNLPSSEAINNPHYLGFAPSTNITTESLLTPNSETISPDALYDFPVKCIQAMVKDPLNFETNDYGSTSLMKDNFITPSIFMVINESVGTNL